MSLACASDVDRPFDKEVCSLVAVCCGLSVEYVDVIDEDAPSCRVGLPAGRRVACKLCTGKAGEEDLDMIAWLSSTL